MKLIFQTEIAVEIRGNSEDEQCQKDREIIISRIKNLWINLQDYPAIDAKIIIIKESR